MEGRQRKRAVHDGPGEEEKWEGDPVGGAAGRGIVAQQHEPRASGETEADEGEAALEGGGATREGEDEPERGDHEIQAVRRDAEGPENGIELPELGEGENRSN